MPLMVALLIVAVLVGCAGDTQPSAEDTATQSTPVPTATPTPVPTAVPTATPEPTAAAFTLDDVVEAFRQSGVEIGEVRPMTIDDYGAAPKADEGYRFLIPSLGEEMGGRLLRYESAEVLQRAKDYYDELGEQSALLFSHTFTRGDILVQVNGQLPQEAADLLEQALNELDGS